MDKKKTRFDSIPLNYGETKLTILTIQVPFKKALVQSFARKCGSRKKNKFVQN